MPHKTMLPQSEVNTTASAEVHHELDEKHSVPWRLVLMPTLYVLLCSLRMQGSGSGSSLSEKLEKLERKHSQVLERLR